MNNKSLAWREFNDSQLMGGGFIVGLACFVLYHDCWIWVDMITFDLLKRRQEYVQAHIDRLKSEIADLEKLEPSEARDRILEATRKSLAVALGEQQPTDREL